MALKGPSHLHCLIYCALKWHNNNTSLWYVILCLFTANATEPDFKSKDWVFLNYTYKRFEGLTQRGTIPTYMKAGKAWHAEMGRWRCGEKNRRLRTQGRAVEPRWCWRLRCQPLSINLTLITSYLGLLGRCKNTKSSEIKERYRITSVVYIVYTCRL